MVSGVYHPIMMLRLTPESFAAAAFWQSETAPC